MPLREYECPQCGHIEEVLDRGERESLYCGKCRVEMKKLVSAHARTDWLKD